MNTTVVKLGVNIDHVATLRQARGTTYPDPVEAARVCVAAGAHSITVHLREDRRHIQDADVFALKAALDVPLNLEMGCADEIVAIALQVRPTEVCLVPERREELTTEGGLDVAGRAARIFDTVARLMDAGITVSLFVEPDPVQLEHCAQSGAAYVELHTGHFCDAVGTAAERHLQQLVAGAEQARAAGLRVNAGHGIHLGNVASILQIPHLDTLNIGHSIVSRSVMVGLPLAVSEMLAAMAAGPDTCG